MPRTYVKKKPVRYNSDDLQRAKEDVNKGKTIYAAAKYYNIPYETLRRWCVNPPNHQGAGRGTVLTKEEEKYIVDALIFTANCGYPLDRKDLQYMVHSYVQSVGRKTPFKNDTPGYDFIINFERRWKEELARRKPELLIKARAEGLSRYVVDEFFKIYQNVLDENNLNDHPERIFNLDETGLGTDPTKGKVFVPKSARITYSRSGSAGRLQYSVLFVASADGERYPPCVIYKGKGELQSTWVTGGPPDALYGVTESGWMQDYIFEKWLNAFVKQIKHLEKPVLVLFDGHGSHLTYNVTRIARDNGIILLCLPPHTSHALQPLDVGVFAPMKNDWKNILKTWYRESRLKNVDKAIFPSLLKKLVAISFKSNHIIGGFKGSGIYPVNQTVLESKIVSIQSNISAQTNPELGNSQVQETDQSNNSLNSSGLSTKMSPTSKLRDAIINTLSPDQPEDVRTALKNSKAKRRRVQGSCGEVLTTDEVLDRLKEEEVKRSQKKKKRTTKSTTALKKIKQEKSDLTKKISKK